jgi:hypothetical protein
LACTPIEETFDDVPKPRSREDRFHDFERTMQLD